MAKVLEVDRPLTENNGKTCYQICEQASHTGLHHINGVKPFTENSAMAKLWDILGVEAPLTPEMYSSETHGSLNALS